MAQVFAHGVQELISRLQQEGVESGEEKADKLISEANKQAAKILDSAILEAKEIITKAQAEAQREQQAGIEALNLAVRDMLLDFRSLVTRKFHEELRAIVKDTAVSKRTIEKIILIFAKKAQAAVGDYKLDELEVAFFDRKLAPSKELDDLVHGISFVAIESGIDFSGIKINLKDKNISVDFTDDALLESLSSYLNPRFAALLTGLSK